MFSPHLHSLLIQAQIDDLHRQASSRQRFAAIRQGHAAPLSGYLERAIARLDDRAARGATATSIQRS